MTDSPRPPAAPRLADLRVRHEGYKSRPRDNALRDAVDYMFLCDKLIAFIDEHYSPLREAACEAVREMEYLYAPHEGIDSDAQLVERGLTDALAWRHLRLVLKETGEPKNG